MKNVKGTQGVAEVLRSLTWKDDVKHLRYRDLRKMYVEFGLGPILVYISHFAASLSRHGAWEALLAVRTNKKDLKTVSQMVAGLTRNFSVSSTVYEKFGEKTVVEILRAVKSYGSEITINTWGGIPFTPEFIRAWAQDHNVGELLSKVVRTEEELDKYQDLLKWSTVLGDLHFEEDQLRPYIDRIAKDPTCLTSSAKKHYSKKFLFDIFMRQE